MTRKDYVLLANAFLIASKDAQSAAERKGIALALSTVVEALRYDNAGFDEERFIRAAGFR